MTLALRHSWETLQLSFKCFNNKFQDLLLSSFLLLIKIYVHALARLLQFSQRLFPLRKPDVNPEMEKKVSARNNVIRKKGEQQTAEAATWTHKKGKKERAAKSLSLHFKRVIFKFEAWFFCSLWREKERKPQRLCTVTYMSSRSLFLCKRALEKNFSSPFSRPSDEGKEQNLFPHSFLGEGKEFLLHIHHHKICTTNTKHGKSAIKIDSCVFLHKTARSVFSHYFSNPNPLP